MALPQLLPLPHSLLASQLAALCRVELATTTCWKRNCLCSLTLPLTNNNNNKTRRGLAAALLVLSSSPHTRTVSLSRSHILVKLAKPRKNQLNCLCTKWEKYFISLPPFAVYRSSPLRLRFVSASASASLWFSLFFFFLAFLFHRVFVLVFGFSILVLNILKLLLERLGGHRGKGKAGKGRRGSGLHLCLVAWLSSSSSSSLLSTFVVGLSLISFCLSKIQVDIQIR